MHELVVQSLAEATSAERAFFERVAVAPAKWALSPWGDLGGGFWVVAQMDDRVLWYTDIEDGFNVSRFETRGAIPSNEYWCIQDDLRWTLERLAGKLIVGFASPEAL